MNAKQFKIVFLVILFLLLSFLKLCVKETYASCIITGPEDCVGNFTASNYNYNPTTKILRFDSTGFTPDNSSYLPYGYRVIGLFDVTQIPTHLNSFANDTYDNFGTCSNNGCSGAYLDNFEGVSSIDPNDMVEIFVEYPTFPNPTAYVSQQIIYSDLIANSNQNINLNVPVLKQTSDPWKSQIYDSANIWNPTDPTINSFGCALTSAAMVFKYDGIDKLPDGTNLDPGTLNVWLKKQKDGYIGNGKVNWLALSRLSKQAKNVNNLPFDALEYTRTNGNATNALTDALSNNLPGILAEPGHFIVGTGINNGIFSINDPYFSRTSLSDYGNTFQNLGIYTPSHTDLSYIMLTVNPEVNIQLFDSNDNPVGETFTEGPISNPLDPNQNNGSIKIVYLPKPSQNNYDIVISSNSPSNFSLREYLYNKNGDVFMKYETGNVSQGNSETIQLQFDFQGNIYNQNVNFLSTTLDIAKFRKQKLIQSNLLKGSPEELLVKAMTQYLVGNQENEQKYLNELIDYIGQNKNSILEPAYSTLLYDVNYLGSN